MMGSRGLKGGNEYDCLTRGGRRTLKLSSKAIRAAKRSFSKRMRRLAKLEIRKTLSLE